MSLRSAAAFLTGLAMALMAGWVGLPAALYTSTQQPAQFNHRVHKDKGSAQCQDCHVIREDGIFAGIPASEQCATCHADVLGTTANERQVVDRYIKPGKSIEWLVYSRQPMNVRFSHAVHVKLGKLACETCHGAHGASEHLVAYEENRISGYSRNIWGHNIARVGLKAGDGMKMADCERCHAERGVNAGCLGCHR